MVGRFTDHVPRLHCLQPHRSPEEVGLGVSRRGRGVLEFHLKEGLQSYSFCFNSTVLGKLRAERFKGCYEQI
jgi:hypothetical protein